MNVKETETSRSKKCDEFTMWPTSNTQISQTTLPTFPHWDDEKEDKGNARLHGHSLRSSPQKKAEGFNSLSQGSLFVWVAMGLPNVQIIILSGYHFVAPIHSKVIWSPQRFWSLYIFHIMTSHHITSIKIPDGTSKRQRDSSRLAWPQ